MSPSFTGGVFGLLLGLMAWAICQFVASRLERGPNAAKNASTAKLIRAAGVVVMIMDIVFGYLFMGPALEGLLG